MRTDGAAPYVKELYAAKRFFHSEAETCRANLVVFDSQDLAIAIPE